MKHICQFCSKEFEHPNSKRKLCNKECATANRKGKKRPLHGELVSKSLIEYYKTDKYQLEKEGRYEKIAYKRRKYLTEEELILLNKYLEAGYIRNILLLEKLVCKNTSYKAILNEFKKDLTLKEKYNKTIKALPLVIQNYDLETWEIIKQHVINCNRHVLNEKYKIRDKTYYRLREFIPECSQQKSFNAKETEPERIIRKILDELNLVYKREKYIASNKWIVDFAIDNIFIEVQGDYWHGNEKVFTFDKLNKVQLRNKLNDEKKKEWILSEGFILLEIWELDIYKNLNNIKILIQDYVSKKQSERFFTTSIWN
jgi:G:T-mismatch repair DNA endonuclease (very short patch repair protein)